MYCKRTHGPSLPTSKLDQTKGCHSPFPPTTTLSRSATAPTFELITALPPFANPPPAISTPPQTCQYVVASNSGNNYILVLYDFDSNIILVKPLQSCTGPCILAGCQLLHARLVAAGLRPKLQRLDNECSSALKQFMIDKDVDYQLVPPNLYHQNAAECETRTFKNRFIAGICGVDKDFPLHLWDKLLPQAELTLNPLRSSRLNPRLSAYAQLHGFFDFNRTPVAPPGIRVLVHLKPSKCTTWSPHGADGWHVGPALELHRRYTVWLWVTRATLARLPAKGKMPLALTANLILAGVHELLHALHHPSLGSPLAPMNASHTDARTQLTSILTSVAAPRRTFPMPHTAAPPLDPTATADPLLRVGAPAPGTSPPVIQYPTASPLDAHLRVLPLAPPTGLSIALSCLPETVTFG